jgi:hypothetical protein
MLRRIGWALLVPVRGVVLAPLILVLAVLDAVVWLVQGRSPLVNWLFIESQAWVITWPLKEDQ